MPPKPRDEWTGVLPVRSEWDARLHLMVPLLPEGIESVLDLGCYRMSLERMLPATVQRYTPLDCEPRTHDRFILCDLNGTLPDVPWHQAAVASGVLEYLDDVPRLAQWLEKTVDCVVCSYAFRDPWRYAGDETAFVKIWEQAHFVVTYRNWQRPQDYALYRLERAPS